MVLITANACDPGPDHLYAAGGAGRRFSCCSQRVAAAVVRTTEAFISAMSKFI